MNLVHELCPLQLLEVTKKRDILSGWLASIQHLAHMYVVYSRVIIRLNKYNLCPYPYSISYEDTLIQQHNEYQYDRSCWAHPCHLFHCCVTCHVSRGCVTTQWRGRAGRDSAQKLRWTKYFIANVTRPDLTFYWFAAMLEWVLMVAVWDIL